MCDLLQKLKVLIALVSIVLVGCGPIGQGDASVVRGFYPKVRPGMALAEAIAEGEKAQAYDIDFRVVGNPCPEGYIEVGRHSGPPYIRITKAPSDPNRPSSSRAYHEFGYASRDEFACGLAETLPSFYGCKEFRFIFGRYQGWPRSDSFGVVVNEKGLITSVTELREDKSD
jgi:hypothetical protein